MRQKSESKVHSVWVRMVLCLFALCSSTAGLLAQQTPDQSTPSTQSAPSTQSTPGTGSQDVKPVVLVMPGTYSQNIALLGTGQLYMDLAMLETRRRTFLMYGMGVSESYVDNFQANSGSQDGSEFLWTPHVALIEASNHSSFSFQYAPTLLQSTSGPSTREVFQDGNIAFGEPIARNWVLQLSSTNTYGTDASRLLSPLAFNVNGGVPVVDPGSAVFQLNRGDVFTTADTLNLNGRLTASQSLNFSAVESYFSAFDSGISSGATSAEVTYSAAVSPVTAFSIGANYHHQEFSPGGTCNGYGLNLGISHEIGPHISLSAAAGPEFESAPCNKGLGGDYAVSISYPLSRRSRVALTAARSYLTNYSANTQWSDTGAVSYSRQLSEPFQINLNSGYSRSVLVPSSLGTYVGYFAGADLSWNLSRTVSLSTEYRRFEQVSGGPMQGQNVALISLGWNPLPTRIVK